MIHEVNFFGLYLTPPFVWAMAALASLPLARRALGRFELDALPIPSLIIDMACFAILTGLYAVLFSRLRFL